LRAEADSAVAAVGRHDSAALAIARARGDRILDLANRMAVMPSTPADGRREAILAQCRAETGRLTGDPATSGADAWVLVARRWEDLRRPYPAAYAWFRAGECVLALRGPRATAAGHLREAHSGAAGLGATPLMSEIEQLARHARVDLDNARARASAATDGIGLTGRESEVLQFVAAGWSNQQIADALFITRKTASVHVSNIVAKFGAANRVEAAAIAHRLGMVGGPEARPNGS
jgi:DNA-binding CsgD family transcriptional regulator